MIVEDHDSPRPTVAAMAAERVAAVREDPAARIALLGSTYRGPTSRAPRHLPFRRAALSFMHWEAGREFSILSTPTPRAADGGGR